MYFKSFILISILLGYLNAIPMPQQGGQSPSQSENVSTAGRTLSSTNMVAATTALDGALQLVEQAKTAYNTLQNTAMPNDAFAEIFHFEKLKIAAQHVARTSLNAVFALQKFTNAATNSNVDWGNLNPTVFKKYVAEALADKQQYTRLAHKWSNAVTYGTDLHIAKAYKISKGQAQAIVKHAFEQVRKLPATTTLALRQFRFSFVVKNMLRGVLGGGVSGAVLAGAGNFGMNVPDLTSERSLPGWNEFGY